MKKIILLLSILISFALFAEETQVPGDASGKDLEPVLRGAYVDLSGGVVTYLGNAGGDNASLFGSLIGMTIGYDLQLADSLSIGAGFNIELMQLDTKNATLGTKYDSSPWVDDYAPIIPGVDIDIQYIITKRFQLGLTIGFDYFMNAEAYKNDSNEKEDAFMGIGGGLILEYYTYSRHFSIGLATNFRYILDFDGMSVTATPFLKCTF